VRHKAFQIAVHSKEKIQLVRDLLKLMRYDDERVRFMNKMLDVHGGYMHVRLGEIGYDGPIGKYNELGWRFEPYDLPLIETAPVRN
jgi:hypothetical protein